MNLKRRLRGWIGGLAAVALVPGGVVAEVMTVAPDAFPARPITLIVPFPAGGPSDALARAIAQGMSLHLKQPIVVENISGAKPRWICSCISRDSTPPRRPVGPCSGCSQSFQSSNVRSSVNGSWQVWHVPRSKGPGVVGLLAVLPSPPPSSRLSLTHTRPARLECAS